MNIKNIFLSILAIMLFTTCSEEKLTPVNVDDETIPPPVNQVKVKNLSGAVQLTYQIPQSSSLLYVEAECAMTADRITTTKASYYQHTLQIMGFGDSKPYEVKLYSVGRNLKRSEPVIVQVHPLDPPIWGIYQSLQVVEDFGGLSIDFENQTEAEVSVVVERQDSLGDWDMEETFYTNEKSGRLSVRGLKAQEQNFRIFVNDRWNNRSETLQTTLTPLYEEELDYMRFAEHKLVNDPPPFSSTKVASLWNNNLSGSATNSGGWYRTANGSGIPNQVTIDMGVTAKLSRLLIWQRGTVSETALLYAGGSPRYFEIWGSNNPNPNGTYDDSWIKLTDGEIVKPSGQPLGNNSPDDIAIAAKGHELIIPLEALPVRYIRFRVMRTFGVTDYFWLSEINFYGQIQNQ